MKIALGADHRGVRYKGMIAGFLSQEGHVVEDFGTNSEESCDYPDYAFPVAQAVAGGRADRGILICSSGIGMSMAANRVRGIRAALCLNTAMARVSRAHNNANVLCMGQDMVSASVCLDIVREWLSTEFEGGRHSRRISKIEAYSRSG